MANHLGPNLQETAPFSSEPSALSTEAYARVMPKSGKVNPATTPVMRRPSPRPKTIDAIPLTLLLEELAHDCWPNRASAESGVRSVVDLRIETAQHGETGALLGLSLNLSKFRHLMRLEVLDFDTCQSVRHLGRTCPVIAFESRYSPKKARGMRLFRPKMKLLRWVVAFAPVNRRQMSKDLSTFIAISFS